MKTKYARFYALLNQINSTGASITKEELIAEFTNGKTNSLTSLQHWEFQELERQLIAKVQSKKPEFDVPKNLLTNDSTRKAIISQFLSIGRTVQDAKDWCEKYGVNGAKKAFNQYTGQELFMLLQNAKKVKNDFIKSASKKIING